MNDRVSILRHALELTGDARLSFVREACGADTALHEDVLQLLALDAADDELLDAQADPLVVALLADQADTVDEELEGIATGDRIGPWQILDRLGAGGMGSVWLAEREDGGVRQTAALKCIKPGMDSAAVLRAFQRERELLVRLEHPGIANLIDSGLDVRGRPWYAMRHVEGITLEQWLHTAPSLRQRLELFVALCRIVAYAHRQLVIHRDLKPSNVMVQLDGTPCLLDFGIAKLFRDDTQQRTATLMRFASSAYAAPEQIEGGAVSTATDVYGLGAILFEMLTGQRHSQMHRAAGEGTTQPSRAVQSRPDDPRAVPSSRLKGDLDAITMRAMAREPARRYGSAEALAEDVQRYLSGQPVQARPDGFAYRVGKWVGRNRLATVGLLLALVAMLAGTGISLVQARRAEAQAARANAIKTYLIGVFDAGRTNSEGTAALQRRVIDLLNDSASRLTTELAEQPQLRDEIYTILIEIFDSNEAGNGSEALARVRLTQAEAAFGADDPRTASARLLLAGVLLNHHFQYPQVPSLLLQAEGSLARDGWRDPLAQAQLYQHQATYAGQIIGHGSISLGLYAKAADVLRRHEPDGDELMNVLLQTAQSALFSLNPDTPERVREALVELRQRVHARYGDHHKYLNAADFIEARLLLETGHPQEALTRIRALRAEIVQFSGETHADAWAARYVEIEALLALGQVSQAAEDCQAAIERLRAMPARDEGLIQGFIDLRETIEATPTVRPPR
ncbi:MAG: serine/threonine protein kinase [Xanthomonadales bacterium]|nr:serine/threonine protein kinase [Xanthomonadales bacterium]